MRGYRALDLKTKDNKTPLMLSVILNKESIFAYLINKRANMDYVDDDAYSALHFAIKKRSGYMFSTLLEAEADWGSKNGGIDIL
jgi:ankyrin repeat protein